MQAAEVQQYLNQILARATAVQLKFSENDAEYTLEYIASALGRTVKATEDLSDMLMDLTRVELQVIEEADRLQHVYELKEAAERDTDAYMNYDRGRRTAWLKLKIQSYEQTANDWAALVKAFTLIKRQVVSRAATVKRIESAVRLHARIFDLAASGHGSSVKPGYISRPAPTGIIVPVTAQLDPTSENSHEINLR